jgi:hypothetical protein
LHPPEASADSLPEIAFSVEPSVRRRGVGSVLFKRVLSEARWRGYRTLRVTTGAQNQAMRALASKFGAHLTFRHGESTGTVEVKQYPSSDVAKIAIDAPFATARAVMDMHRAYWKLFSKMSGSGGAA